jgi:sterol desaturase/sphingolipid hydroxylase (fatty acid hydroxylase superfamily)
MKETENSESSYSESENSESENVESKNLERMLSLSVKKKDVSVKMSIPRNIISNVRQLWDSICITLFVIGTAIVIFIAARNSITWHLQHFWGASGSYWQSKWEYIYSLFDGNEISLAMWGTLVVLFFAFWGSNGFLMILDMTGRPQFLLKYKIQEEKNQPVDRRKLLSAILLVIFNQVVVSVPFFYLSFLVMKWRGCSFGPELPAFHWVVFELVVFSLIEEVMFYYSHRMLHQPMFYRHIHKKHHEWTAPIGVTSIYAHPIEHIFSNLLPPVMGPFLMGSHIATAIMWFTLAVVSTTVSHCGYHFPFLPSPEAHDFHHYKFVNNFGMLGVLDRLHGTDTLFRASKAYQRHYLLLGLVPLSQQIPDNKKQCKEDEQHDQ